MKKLFRNLSVCAISLLTVCGVSMTSCSSSSSSSDSDSSAEFLKSLSDEDLSKIRINEGESIIGAKHMPYNGKDVCAVDLDLIKELSEESGGVDFSNVNINDVQRFDVPNKGAYLQAALTHNGGDRTLYYANGNMDGDEYTGVATILQNSEDIEAELQKKMFEDEPDSSEQSSDNIGYRALKIMVFSVQGQFKSRMFFTDATVDGVKERVMTIIAEE